MEKKFVKIAVGIAICFLCIFLLTGCAKQEAETQVTDSMFTDNDMEIGYDEETATKITLTGDSAESDSDAVTISGSVVTISEEGTYILSGTLNDGMVIVDAGDEDKLRIVLDDASITSQTSAALYVRNADKVFVTTATDSHNSLVSAGEYVAIDDNDIDAAVFAKSDLTLNGAGQLTITSAAGHGVVSKDDLVLTGGDYSITAASQGLSGEDSVRIANGQYSIEAGNDGIHAENDADAEPAFIYVAGGTLSITSTDDGVNSNGDITIKGGAFEIESGDDGIHADDAVVIDDGEITVTNSYEGIEGLSVDINDGVIDITASDDGLNAAGGTDESGFTSGFGSMGGEEFAATEGAYIKITGGETNINASGDGIDSNGDLYVTGGETYVSGPVDSANGTFDYNGEPSISGGIFVAAGPTEMAQNFGESSTKGSMLVSINGSAQSTITLTDADGNQLVSWEADKAYSSVVISCPDITEGETYTVAGGSSTVQVTMDSLIYGASGGMGGQGGGMAGGPGMSSPPDGQGGKPQGW